MKFIMRISSLLASHRALEHGVYFEDYWQLISVYDMSDMG